MRIFTDQFEWGETAKWLHPFSLAVDVLNPSDRFTIRVVHKISLRYPVERCKSNVFPDTYGGWQANPTF